MPMRSPFEKVVKGIIQYTKTQQAQTKERLLALKASKPPISAAFVTCMDARLVPSVITQTLPRDMFVLRNPGNIIRKSDGIPKHSYPEVAGLELTVVEMGVRDVVVCGHSNCQALKSLYMDCHHPHTFASHSCAHNFLLINGQASFDKLVAGQKDKFRSEIVFNEHGNPTFSLCKNDLAQLPDEDQLSHIHCLQQLEHALSYKWMSDLVNRGTVRLHAMWFDVLTAEMWYYSYRDREFMPFSLIADELLNEVTHGNTTNSIMIPNA